MATKNTYILMSDPRNQFSFTCPVFEVTTKIALCFKLRDMFWAGAKPEVRRGCQACMRAGKCAAAAISSKKYPAGKTWQDEYASDEPVQGRIRKDILERIHRPMVMERTLNEFGCSDAERLKIATASDRIGKMLGAPALPGDDDDHVPTRTAPAGSAVKKRRSAPKPTAINHAAATGDLAAAVNA